MLKSLRVSLPSSDKYEYVLNRHDAHIVRSVGCIQLFLLLNITVGFWLVISRYPPLSLMFVPFFLVVLLYSLLDGIIMTRYPAFSTAKHEARVQAFRQAWSYPKVAVMIPAAGEDISIVQKTMQAAAQLDYPNYRVFVLDDSRDGRYHDMAKGYATYFRRSNVGWHKKAGNLNALSERIHGHGYDYILILDADFVPVPTMLAELVPYATADVAVVQSPQHFALDNKVYKRSKFEYGAALIQRDFYRLTQPARNTLGGAICVGTNALYSVEALERVGGFEGIGSAAWGHSEDVHTGLKMINTVNPAGNRYRIEYVPVQLATGLCPSTHLSFYNQQNRWASGSMQLIFSKKTLFSSVLSLPQKLCYFSNSVYYFFTMMLLFSPLQLLGIILPRHGVDWPSTMLFLPYLLFSSLLGPWLLRRNIRPLASSLVVLSNAYTFVYALFLLIIRRPIGWEATGSEGAKTKKSTAHFMWFKVFCVTFFVIVYVPVMSILLINQRLALSPSMIVAGLFVAAFGAHLVYLHYMLVDARQHQHSRDVHSYVYAALILLLIVVIGGSISIAGRLDVRFSPHTVLVLQPDNLHSSSYKVDSNRKAAIWHP